jgi:hypothetical protein
MQDQPKDPPASQDASTGRPVLDQIRDVLSREEVPLGPGDLLGRYRLLEPIGAGAFGDVWLARDTSSSTEAAIKVFVRGRFQPTSQASAAVRFHDGAVAMRRLQDCPEVVRIIEGPTADLLTGHIWFSMKYYPTRDLTSWIKSTDIDVDTKLSLLRDVLSALKAAHTHAEPIIHRDVRPQNILIDNSTGTPHAILTDFDIAYYEDLLRQRERTTTVLGNPRFIPPEVFGAATDTMAEALRRPQNDLYALAVVTLDLFATSEINLPPKRSLLLRALPSKSSRRPLGMSWGLRREVAAFLLRALNQVKEERFQRATEYEQQWAVATRTRQGKHLAIVVIGVLLTLSTAVLTDWVWYASRDRPLWATFVGLVAGLASVASGLGTLEWLRAWIGSATPSWRQQVLRTLLDHPRLSWASLALVTSSAALCAAKSNLPHRLMTARIVMGRGCVAVDRGSAALLVGDVDLGREFSVAHIEEIRCARAHSATARIEGLSRFTHLPSLTTPDHPEAVFTVRSIDGATQMTAEYGSKLIHVNLAGVQTFPASSVESQGLRKLANEGEMPVGSTVTVAFHFPSFDADVEKDGRDVARELLARGLLQVASGSASDDYARMQESASTSDKGLWHDVHTSKRRADLIAKCGTCCSEVPCEEVTGCVERARCYACRDGVQARHWHLSLARRLNIGDRARWHSVKVCLAASGCSQECVDEDQIGGPLGTFGCDYSATDFHPAYLKIVGRESEGGRELRIAEKNMEIWTRASGEALCSGVQFTDLQTRKDSVGTVYLSARLEPQ